MPAAALAADPTPGTAESACDPACTAAAPLRSAALPANSAAPTARRTVLEANRAEPVMRPPSAERLGRNNMRFTVPGAGLFDVGPTRGR